MNKIKLAMTRNINGVDVEYGRLPERKLGFYFRTRNLYDTEKFENTIRLFIDEIIEQESHVNHGVEWRAVGEDVLDWNEYLQTIIIDFEIRDVY